MPPVGGGSLFPHPYSMVRAFNHVHGPAAAGSPFGRFVQGNTAGRNHQAPALAAMVDLCAAA